MTDPLHLPGLRSARPKARAILANAPALRLVLSLLSRSVDCRCREIGCTILLGKEATEMLPNNVAARGTLDAFGLGIPIRNPSVRVKHIDCVVDDALDQATRTGLPPFPVPQPQRATAHCGNQLCGAFGHPGLQRFLAFAQSSLDTFPPLDFILGGPVERSLVDGYARLHSYGRNNALGPLAEHPDFRMSKEQAAQHPT